MIPLLRPYYFGEEADAVQEVLKSGWWGNGPKCEEFEEKLAEYYGMRHCVSLNSATAALHLSLLAKGVGPGDEVIVPALTFISTALAVWYCGAWPVFADVNSDTLCLDWRDVIAKWTDRTRLAISVDYAGHPASPGPTQMLERRYVIQDAAHSCGGGVHGDLVCLSFHPVKPLATGDGGAVLTNSEKLANAVRGLRWCGIDNNTWQRARKKYGWDYAIEAVGYKAHWNDLQAAIGLVQLRNLDWLKDRRREIAERYTAELGHIIQVPRDHREHTWHLYPIRVAAGERDALIDHLLAQGISAGVHYKPLTYYPMFSEQETPPVTEREWRRLVSIPIFPGLEEAAQYGIINSIKSFYQERSNESHDLRKENCPSPA